MGTLNILGLTFKGFKNTWSITRETTGGINEIQKLEVMLKKPVRLLSCLGQELKCKSYNHLKTP